MTDVSRSYQADLYRNIIKDILKHPQSITSQKYMLQLAGLPHTENIGLFNEMRRNFQASALLSENQVKDLSEDCDGDQRYAMYLIHWEWICDLNKVYDLEIPISQEFRNELMMLKLIHG